MSCLTFSHKRFTAVYLQRSARNFPAVARFQRAFPETGIIEVDDRDEIPEKETGALYLCRSRGDVLSRCPGSRGHICCNYLTLDQYIGCDIGCTYCIMQYYLNFSPITVYVDTAPGIAAVRKLAVENPETVIRVGTGEVGDSLFLDAAFGLAEEYIRGLSGFKNVYLELKTKTAQVDHLLRVPEKGNAVIAFSLNPGRVADAEEGAAAPVRERLNAAARILDAGYLTAFHFDPIVYYPGWQEDYSAVVDLLQDFPCEKIRWISLGTMRYPPGLKDKMGRRRYLLDEYVRSADGKFRYIQKKRIGIYRYMLERIRNKADIPVYLCMESPAVWRAVFGNIPGNIPGLRDIFKRVKVEGETGIRNGVEER